MPALPTLPYRLPRKLKKRAKRELVAHFRERGYRLHRLEWSKGTGTFHVYTSREAWRAAHA